MYFSILGDSISTFMGYNPNGFSVFYDTDCCAVNGLQTVNDTWWSRVIQFYNGKLSVNNSYSGSRVAGTDFPAANQMIRLNYFKDGHLPDYLLVYIGFNDFGYGVEIRKTGLRLKRNAGYFEDAYELLVKNLKRLLPDTTIICGTLLKTYIESDNQWTFPNIYNGHTAFDNYNDIIRHVCHKNSIAIADLAALNIKYGTLDGTHPTAAGHKEIADAWIAALNHQNLIKQDRT